MHQAIVRATLFGLVVLACACSQPTREVAGPDENSHAAAAVKERLIKEGTVEPSRVRVHEENGRIYLEGTVDSVSEKMRAGQVAQGTPGVGDVVNDLLIAPAKGTAPLGTPPVN